MAKRSGDDHLPEGTPAEVVEEYGPFVPGEDVHGVSYDGERVWFATGKKLRALDPARKTLTAELALTCDAGTAFDGEHLYQLAHGRIHKLDPRSGQLLGILPWRGGSDAAGLAWAEGKLWVGQHRGRKIVQIDPESGDELRSVESNRFVTGVTWLTGELWHGTLEDGVSELRRVEPETGEVLTRLVLPEGTVVTGLEADGAELFYCGGGRSGKLRAVRRARAR